MTKELRELLEKQSNLKKEARDLLKEDKLEEARAKTDEAKELDKKIVLLRELEEEEDIELEKKAKKHMEENERKKDEVDEVRSFVNVLKHETGISSTIDPKDEEIVRSIMTENSPEDGGLTVPKDIQTKINELRRGYPDNLEQYVNVEKVNTLSGSRVVEVEADFIPFDKVNEAQIFPDVDTPKFEDISYKVDKFGGTFQLSYELLQDTAENIMSYIQKWAAKKGKATRNAFILKVLEETYGTEKSEIKVLDDLKDIFNVELDPAIALTSMVITNQDGFNYLDKMKDTDGKYVLQPDLVNATQRLLFGKYPVAVVHNKTLPTVEGKAPIYCGDMKEAITLFDREAFGLEFTNQGPNWNKDLIDAKARERLDVKAFDTKAVIAGEIPVETPKTQEKATK